MPIESWGLELSPGSFLYVRYRNVSSTRIENDPIVHLSSKFENLNFELNFATHTEKPHIQEPNIPHYHISNYHERNFSGLALFCTFFEPYANRNDNFRAKSILVPMESANSGISIGTKIIFVRTRSENSTRNAFSRKFVFMIIEYVVMWYICRLNHLNFIEVFCT